MELTFALLRSVTKIAWVKVIYLLFSKIFKKKLYPISWTLLMASKFRDTFFCLHFLYVSSILNSQNEQNLLIREYLLLSLQILEKSLNIVSLIFFQRFL